MRAGRVHSVIAAGLEDPRLLARWRHEPELLRGCGVDPAALDLEALWKFAGLSAKVKHNGLRADLPLTFRLMNVAGLEIEVFASYAAARADDGRRYAETPAARAADLSDFLKDWLDFGRREHAMLWDVLRYEMALARLRRAAAAEAETETQGPRSAVAPNGKSVPGVRGEVILHEMRCDPRAVAETLWEKTPRLGDVPLGAHYFCFWRRGAGTEVHILQLDELGFYLLSLADGRRTAARISRALGGGARPAKGFLAALGELAEFGILTFDAS